MKRILLGVGATIAVVFAAFVGYVYMVNRPLPSDPTDTVILERTLELLSNPTTWSKEDNRSCGDDTKITLYCALKKASVDVTGEFKHRAASLQEVRYAIERLHPDKEYAHRLQDFNNDDEISLIEIRLVVEAALEALRSKS